MIETRDSNQPDLPPLGYNTRHIILAIVLVGLFMCVLDVQIVAIALPTLMQSLGAGIGEVQWIATGYVIVVLATVLLFGSLSHSLGNGRLFKAGLLLFTLSSLGCGLSQSIPELILFRILQAVGASMLMGVSVAIIIQVFPPGEQGRAMGYYTAVIALGLIVGPSAGGFIVDLLSWPFIFLVNVPIGLVLLVCTLRYLTVDRDPPAVQHFDYHGAFFLIGLMASLSLALNTLSNPPIRLDFFGIWSGIFLLLLIAFVARERSVDNPILPITIFCKRSFLLPTISLILYIMAVFLLLTIQPFYFEYVMGLRPSHIGLIALILPLSMLFASPVFGWLYDRYRSSRYPFIGIVIVGSAFLGCGAAFSCMDFGLIIALFIIGGISRSIYQGPNSIEIMTALPPAQQGIGSSLLTALQYLGILLGISFATFLMTAQLDVAGYSELTDAGPTFLAAIFGNCLYIAGLLCLAGAVCEYKV
ncbi:MFS transporter [Methanosphaerula palustris]|uniref:Drug resistance transporter, EmrB/QacA subfamily n=1 Tax=Methanosphaerula palustris (strain ATCC BAA-1556 / DSM 19958 / E1-9c) TaxID=521011 RepID=B8GHK7_METPE|nr:MFS transporter [Methanosphaerula palustris]ACL16612.1 drug resistance transporter, EmrB/QacA subfamily [Methanosphaerula palustris E1-9c]